MLLLILVEFVDFKGKKLQSLIIGRTNVELKTYMAIWMSYLAVLTLFVLFAMVRVMIRRATKTEQYSNEYSDCFDKCKPITRLLWYMLFVWIMGCGWGVVFWWIFGAREFIMWGVLGTPCIIFFMRGMVYFKLNEF